MGTISDSYRSLLQRTHADSPGWGNSAYKAADRIRRAISPDDRRILDYGCGKGSLKAILQTPTLLVDEYDPGIKGKDTPPEGPYDLVVCVDVLEHVEPEFVDAVLDDLFRLSKDVFVIVDTYAAKKILPDGRNAHLSIAGSLWWQAKLDARGFALFTESDGRRLEALYART